MWFIFTNNCFFYIWYDVFESGFTYYTRIVPKCYLVLYHALYLDILYLLYSWWYFTSKVMESGPSLYPIFLFMFSSSSLFAASLILLSTSNFSQLSSESHLTLNFFLFYYKTNILVRELDLTCLSMEWCWNEEKLLIQLLLL